MQLLSGGVCPGWSGGTDCTDHRKRIQGEAGPCDLKLEQGRHRYEERVFIIWQGHSPLEHHQKHLWQGPRRCSSSFSHLQKIIPKEHRKYKDLFARMWKITCTKLKNLLQLTQCQCGISHSKRSGSSAMALFIRRNSSISIKSHYRPLGWEEKQLHLPLHTRSYFHTPLILLLANKTHKRKPPWRPASLFFSLLTTFPLFLCFPKRWHFFPPGTVPLVITMVFAQELTVHKHVILYK